MRPNEIGLKFEIWLEESLNRKNLLRNVEYHKAKYTYRQVDLSYDIVEQGRIKQVIIEAKYSSNGSVSNRINKETKNDEIITIEDLVTEVEERRLFCNADYACLVTNNRFAKEVHEKSKNFGIQLIEFQKEKDDEIKSVKIDDYNLYKNIIYLS